MDKNDKANIRHPLRGGKYKTLHYQDVYTKLYHSEKSPFVSSFVASCIYKESSHDGITHNL